ncbi:MAG: hypothetical protein AAF211_32395 [Myxococcota bacterium]
MSTTMHRAQTLGQGNVEVSLEPGVSGLGLGGGDAEVPVESVVVPTFWVSARYGVTDRFDIGGRIGSGFVEIHTNIMLTNPEADLRVSLAPYGTPLFFGLGSVGGGALFLNVPVLIGIPIGDSELTLGPGVRTSTFFAAGAGGTIVEPSGSIGISAQLGDNFRLHPEFGIAYGAFGIGSAGEGAETISAVGASRFSFALGFQFGSPNRQPGG